MRRVGDENLSLNDVVLIVKKWKTKGKTLDPVKTISKYPAYANMIQVCISYDKVIDEMEALFKARKASGGRKSKKSSNKTNQ